jgi:hypothetical protein
MKFPAFIGGSIGTSSTARVSHHELVCRERRVGGGRNKRCSIHTWRADVCHHSYLNGRKRTAQAAGVFRIGSKLFEVFSDFSVIDRGNVATDANPRRFNRTVMAARVVHHQR